jgi:hypothetical protein
MNLRTPNDNESVSSGGGGQPIRMGPGMGQKPQGMMMGGAPPMSK